MLFLTETAILKVPNESPMLHLVMNWVKVIALTLLDQSATFHTIDRTIFQMHIFCLCSASRLGF